ncbi:MAG: HIT family protein [Bacteroidales bacterium]|nr:HIT family protein [Bacteroidales bacterium]
MASIFSRIAQGEIPSWKVAEDEKHYAFLDINPLTEGHTLVIPRKEIDYVFDLDEPAYSELFLFARKVARAIQSQVDCIRMGMVVYGLDVPHAHIHLIPLKGQNDIDFSKPKVQLSQERFRDIASAILKAFQELD